MKESLSLKKIINQKYDMENSRKSFNFHIGLRNILISQLNS